jgi:ATP-dependent RNA helicase DDX6/DHH1
MLCVPRFNLYTIEQELGTEIMPIPPVIDRSLYVAGSAPPATLAPPSNANGRAGSGTSTPSNEAARRRNTPTPQLQHSSQFNPADYSGNAAMIARAQGGYQQSVNPQMQAMQAQMQQQQQQQQQQIQALQAQAQAQQYHSANGTDNARQYTNQGHGERGHGRGRGRGGRGGRGGMNGNAA